MVLEIILKTFEMEELMEDIKNACSIHRYKRGE